MKKFAKVLMHTFTLVGALVDLLSLIQMLRSEKLNYPQAEISLVS